MKRWKTTDTGPQNMPRGGVKQAMEAAGKTLKKRNGGISPNLHMANRLVLLKVIKELKEKLERFQSTRHDHG
jgi:hypothetical protein